MVQGQRGATVVQHRLQARKKQKEQATKRHYKLNKLKRKLAQQDRLHLNPVLTKYGDTGVATAAVLAGQQQQEVAAQQSPSFAAAQAHSAMAEDEGQGTASAGQPTAGAAGALQYAAAVRKHQRLRRGLRQQRDSSLQQGAGQQVAPRLGRGQHAVRGDAATQTAGGQQAAAAVAGTADYAASVPQASAHHRGDTRTGLQQTKRQQQRYLLKKTKTGQPLMKARLKKLLANIETSVGA